VNYGIFVEEKPERFNMLEYQRYIIIGLFFIITILLHEYVHYLVLKRYGGKGKLAILRGSFKLPTIGIKYQGGLSNWKQVVHMKLAPIPVTFCMFYFIAISIVRPSNFNGYLISFIFGLALTWIACLKDLRDSMVILSKGTDENFDDLFKPGMRQ